MPQNPFIFFVGVMNFGAAIWYLVNDSKVMASAMFVYTVAAVIQSFVKVN